MTIDSVVERVANGGNLLENLALIDINTWQTAQEVFATWQSGAPVEGVNTANMAIYRLVDGEVVFDLLGKEGNLFFDDRFREDAYNGILRNEFFFPQGAMKQRVLSAITSGQTVTVNYSGLNIKTYGCSKNYCYIEADESNTPEEKKLFSAVYGTDNPGKGKKIYLLRENVVRTQLKDKQDDFIGRACFFFGNQYFNAEDCCIKGYLSAVRGIRRAKVTEGETQKPEAVV